VITQFMDILNAHLFVLSYECASGLGTQVRLCLSSHKVVFSLKNMAKMDVHGVAEK